MESNSTLSPTVEELKAALAQREKVEMQQVLQEIADFARQKGYKIIGVPYLNDQRQIDAFWGIQKIQPNN